MSRSNKPPPKDMYWFAHGGAESENSSQRNIQVEDDEMLASNSPTWNISADRKGTPEESRVFLVTDGVSSSGPTSLEREDRLRMTDRRLAVEERRKQLMEAEQERNDAVLRKHMEREAAMEARRNAQRSNISFAFGSSIPRNIDTLYGSESGDSDVMSRSFTASGLSQKEENHIFHDRRSVSPLNYNGYSLVDGVSHRSESSHSCTTYSERRVLPPPSWLTGSGALIGDDVMSRSMNAAISAPRGRRKNDLTPHVPYERTPPTKTATSSSTRKRSVSMTRLDQLAMPRRHYVEANKANSTASSGTSSVMKDHIRSPTRPLSSASEHSGGSGRISSTVNRRVRSSPRKPRPVSIAGTLPDQRSINNNKPYEVKVSPIKRSYTPSKRTTELSESRKNTQSASKSSTPKVTEKAKPSPRPTSSPKYSTPKAAVAPKTATPKTVKQVESKPPGAKSSTSKTPTPKAPTPKVKENKSQPIKKKVDTNVASPAIQEAKEKSDVEKPSESTASSDGEVAVENEKNNAKRIISEEEAKAALAEKRRLAREQAEREAELERQRQEQLRLEEEERLRKEEEDHRKMEEEQIRLLEEHRRQEEEKLRKAIEEQQQKEEEEKAKRDEELQMKAEQERKAKEEAEKQRLELEEKLRKEEEERAERKKRLEKIMSRTRGKSSGTSPSGSVSGSEQLDSGENAHEGFSSGANSLDSNETGELPSEQVSADDHLTKTEISSVGNSMEANPTYEIGSENESLNSNELMMPSSETASQDNSMIILPEKNDLSIELDHSNIVDVESEVTKAESSDLCAEFEQSSTVVQTLTESGKEETITQMLASENIASVAEIQSPVILEIEETEINFVEEKNEISGEVVKEESSFSTEVEEKVSAKNYSENLMSQSMYQHLAGDQDVVSMVEQTTTNEVVSENETQMHFESKFGEEIGREDTFVGSSEVTAQFNESEFQKPSDEFINIHEMEHSQDIPVMLPEPASMPSNLPFGSDAVDFKEQETSEAHCGSSISSDFKLPDPIYETSDEGSISSEKHQQFGHQDDTTYVTNEEHAVSDDVFSEQAVLINSESSHQYTDIFKTDVPSENVSSVDGREQVIPSSESNDNQLKNNFEETSCFDISESMYQGIAFSELEQPREIGEENVILSRSSTSSVIEADRHTSPSVLTQDDLFYQGNKENTSTEVISSSTIESTNQQFTNENVNSAYNADSDNENIISALEIQNAFGETALQDSKLNLETTGDNPFSGNPFSGNSDIHTFQPPEGDFYIDQQHSFAASEQMDYFEIKTIQSNELISHSEQVSDVTIIKSDDNSGTCVGIISSIDNDHTLNDFPKSSLHTEQLKSNFEYVSMTDSENSSLDSNLSQVMNLEHSENDTVGGLNHTENLIGESNSNQQVFSNGEQHNPFEFEHINNFDSNSKSNVNNFSSSELSNGHSFESSKQAFDQVGELHDYKQLDGNGILSVDHSQNNIFENADSIDFGKVTPDPFLAKGNSKQISGNPFLLQDDQKQVLMTPDFLN